MQQKKYLRINDERWGTQNFYCIPFIKRDENMSSNKLLKEAVLLYLNTLSSMHHVLFKWIACVEYLDNSLPCSTVCFNFAWRIPLSWISFSIFLSSMLYRLSFLCSSTHSSTAVLNDIIWWRYFQDVDDKELIYTYATKC